MFLIILLFILAGPAGAASEWAGSVIANQRYHESLAAYRQGQYEKALEGFMDVLLEDPEYPQAHERLNQTAKMLLKIEEGSVEKERRKIMADIERESMSQRDIFASASGMEKWDHQMRQALSLAKDPAKLSLALEAYNLALQALPVTHHNYERFIGAREQIRQALAGAFPHLAAGRLNLDTGELGGEILHEMRAARSWEDKDNRYGEYLLITQENADQTELAARALGKRERDLERALSQASEAYREFTQGRLDTSSELWRQVLRADPRNLEAAYFIKQAIIAPPEAHAAAKTPPPAVPPRRMAAAPVPPPAVRRVSPKFEAPPTKIALEIPPKVEPAPAPPPASVPSPAPPVNKEIAQEYYQKGLRAYSLGNLEQAIVEWRACLELDADHPKAKKALERANMENK